MMTSKSSNSPRPDGGNIGDLAGRAVAAAKRSLAMINVGQHWRHAGQTIQALCSRAALAREPGLGALAGRLGAVLSAPVPAAGPSVAEMLAGLPRHVGWHRSDWRPQAPGPVASLVCHCQTQPDTGADRQPLLPANSPWRFEVELADADGRTYALYGRLDSDALHLLLRSGQAVTHQERTRLATIVNGLRLTDGRPVALRFDVANTGATQAAAQRAVDRRA